MLVKRKEDHVHHCFFNSTIGVSDWIARNYDSSSEIQVVSAFQNYGLLLRFVANRPIEIIPSDDPSDYQEEKKRKSGRTLSHRIRGAYYLHVNDTTGIGYEDPLLESMRGIRLYQEGGEKEYLRLMGEESQAGLSLVSRKGKDIKIEIERNFRQILHYRAVVTIHTASERTDGRKFMIPPGRLFMGIELELTGAYPDEDYGAYTLSPFELLKPELTNHLEGISGSQYSSLKNQLEALTILIRKRKLLAGGPRFLTYFGRDTLISLAVLTGTIVPDIAIQGFKSVLERLSPEGEVAHEETVGEFCAYSVHHGTEFPGTVLDYHMVDDDFLLTAVLGRWIEREGFEEIQKLLEKIITGPGDIISSGFERLGKNITYCFNRLKQGLVPYHQAVPVGDWRDSLAFQGVHYSYEVNMGLAAGFLQTVRKLIKDLPPLKECIPEEILSEKGEDVLRSFLSDAGVFRRTIKKEEAVLMVGKWIRTAGFNREERSELEKRLKSVNVKNESYAFFSMALDAGNRSIDIQHNDVAFAFLFGNPCLSDIETMLTPLETPFPLGLKTDVGILVSNPVFADDESIRRDLNRSHYHGLVIWPLMHNLIFHGIERQLRLLSIPAEDSVTEEKRTGIIERLLEMKTYLSGLPAKLGDFNASELWTFSPRKDGDRPLAFGRNTGSSTESNPVQLWSSLGFTGLFT